MDTRTVEGRGWRLTIPAPLTAIPARPSDGATSMTIVRGWLGEAALELGVYTLPSAGTTLRKHTARLTRWFMEPASEVGTEVRVPGARGARRTEGLVGPDDEHPQERMVALVAAGRRELVVAVARCVDDTTAWIGIERILASLALVDDASI